MKNKKGEPPLYLTLYEAIRRDILAGVYPHGARLPSKRQIARDRGVSVVTAEHALALLVEEGYAEARERSGCFAAVGDVAFPARGGEPPLFSKEQSDRLARPPVRLPGSLSLPLYARTMRHILSEVGEGLLERSPAAGLVFLRRALSAYLQRARGIHAAPEQILIGAGAEELYGVIAALFCGRTIGIEDPSYERIEKVYRAAGVKTEPLALGRHGIATAALAGATAEVLHVTPYRSYPTGVTATPAKKREYLAFAAEEGRYLIEDDVESEFSPAVRPYESLYSLSACDNVLYLNSFSLTLSPALRTAYLILPRRIADGAEELLATRVCPVPTPEQYLIGYLLASGEFEKHLNRVRRRSRRPAGEAQTAAALPDRAPAGAVTSPPTARPPRVTTLCAPPKKQSNPLAFRIYFC